MGNSQSEAHEQEIPLPEGTYTFNRPYEDIRYGAVQVYSHPQSNNLIAKCSKVDNSEDVHLRRRAEAEAATNLKHPNLIEIRNATGLKKSEACSTFYITNIYAQFLFYGLDQEMEKRRQNKESFHEEELWYVGNSSLSVVDYLASKGIYHEDIRPQNVLIENDGAVRLFWNNAIRPGYNQFVKLSSNERDNECFLSPALYSALGNSGTPMNDPVKSDVFSTGMMLLEMASGSSTIDCYDINGYKVKTEEIDRRLAAASGSYSPEVLSWIKEMLEMDEGRRQDPGYFLGRVPPGVAAGGRILLPNEEKPAHQVSQVSRVSPTPAKRTVEELQPNLVKSQIQPMNGEVNGVSRSRNNSLNTGTENHYPNSSRVPVQMQATPQNLNSQRYHQTQLNSPPHYIPPSTYYAAQQNNTSSLDFLYLNKDYNAPMNLGGESQEQVVNRAMVHHQKSEPSSFESNIANRKFRDYYTNTRTVSPMQSQQMYVQKSSFGNSQIPMLANHQNYVKKAPKYTQPTNLQVQQNVLSNRSLQTQNQQFLQPTQYQMKFQSPQPQVQPRGNFHQAQHFQHQNERSTIAQPAFQQPFNPYPTKQFEAKSFESPIISRSERRDFSSQPVTSMERKKLGPILERDKILQDIDRVNVDQIIQEVKREQQVRVMGSSRY